MPLTLTQIEHEVDALPQEERFQLLEHLQKQLAPEQEELDRIWAEEAEKRYKAYLDGKTTAIPGEDVFAEALERYAK